MLYWVFWDPYFFRLCGKTSLFLKTWSMFLPAFQSVYCYGKTFLKGGNKSCLLEGSQNPSVAALIERQQSPLTTGGAVTGPTLRATEPSMANSVCSPLQLGMDTPLLRSTMDVSLALQELGIVRTHSEIIRYVNRHLSFTLNPSSEYSSKLCRGVQRHFQVVH